MAESSEIEKRKLLEQQLTIRAGERWIDELQFQIRRLNEHVKADTDEEREFHARLLEGYQVGARYSSVLLNYLRGRLSRLMNGDEDKDDLLPSVMEGGRVAPVFEDQEPYKRET